MMTKIKKIKRIFVVTPFENRMAERGTRLPELADFLVRENYRVEYVTTNFSHAYKRHFSPEEISSSIKKVPYGLTVLPISSYSQNVSVRRVLCNIIMAIRHFYFLLQNVKGGDIIIVPSRPVELVFFVALVGKIKKIKIVLDIRDIWPDALVINNKFKKAIFSLYCNAYLYPALRMVKTCVHIAPCFRDWLHRYNPKATSVFIPPGYDEKRWEGLLPRKGLIDDQMKLVFVGLLQLQLDVMPILKALVARPHIQFTLIGDSGTGQRYNEVVGFINENKMKNVRVQGRMDPEKVVEELKKHDVAVVPMISSSIPNKVFDAIASYLPLIVLGENDCADFVKSQNIGWSAPFDGEMVGNLLDTIDIIDIIEKQKHISLVRERWSRDILFQDFHKVIISD